MQRTSEKEACMGICIMEPVLYNTKKKKMKLLIYFQFIQLNTVNAKYTLIGAAILINTNSVLRSKSTGVIVKMYLIQLLMLLPSAFSVCLIDVFPLCGGRDKITYLHK
jgi:hypothetical protein